MHSLGEIALVRTAVTGFFLGYVTIALLIAPMALWALEITPSYAGGVVMVIERYGVLAPIQSGIQQLEQTSRRLTQRLELYIADTLEPRHRSDQ